jgi:hypothetical protein
MSSCKPDPVQRVGPASPAIERFARETLGCRCEPEVFLRVEDDPSPLPGLPEVVRRIRIGGRLLVYLIACPDPARAPAGLGDWLAQGRAERDRLGMNRLRLALALGRQDRAAEAALGQTFDRLADGDPRVHLHLLGGGLPGELLGHL